MKFIESVLREFSFDSVAKGCAEHLDAGECIVPSADAENAGLRIDKGFRFEFHQVWIHAAEHLHWLAEMIGDGK